MSVVHMTKFVVRLLCDWTKPSQPTCVENLAKFGPESNVHSPVLPHGWGLNETLSTCKAFEMSSNRPGDAALRL